MSKEHLIAKHQRKNLPFENIEDVDYLWNGEPYAALTGKRHYYDWIIASHVVEHTPDFIEFLKNCASILKNDGALSLVVPDVRYHFDYFRPITGLGKIIDAHAQANKLPTQGTVAECFLNLVSKGGNITWSDPGAAGEFRFIYSLQEVLDNMEAARAQKANFDVHTWQFTPSSFRLLIHDLYRLGMIPFQEVCYYPTAGCEFYITLGRMTCQTSLDRLGLLQSVKQELYAPARGRGHRLLQFARRAFRKMSRAITSSRAE